MPRYQKKPAVITAEHYQDEKDAIRICNWAADAGVPISYHQDARTLTVHTLEGDMLASLGDWIIQGVQGEFYPCKSDIFDATYNPAN